MNTQYHKTLDKIVASESFKHKILQNIDREEERRSVMKMNKKMLMSLAACLILAVGFLGFSATSPTDSNVADINLLDRIVIDANAPSACVAVNLEGTIVEVDASGLRFKLDTGVWVTVDDTTEIGVTLPTAAAIEDQFLEPTFRVGNMIAGFVEDENSTNVTAYAIYTNWNWEDPIRD